MRYATKHSVTIASTTSPNERVLLVLLIFTCNANYGISSECSLWVSLCHPTNAFAATSHASADTQ